MEILFGRTTDLASAIRDLLNNFKEENLKNELVEVMAEIKKAEVTGDSAKLEEYLKKCQTLSNEINNIKNNSKYAS